MATFRNVDAYIGSFPPEVQSRLQAVRQAIHAATPGLEEGISYDIAAIGRGGRYVISFAGWKRHVSVYPIPDTDAALAARLAPYRSGRGTLRFDHDQPLPLDLITRVAVLLVEQRLK